MTHRVEEACTFGTPASAYAAAHNLRKLTFACSKTRASLAHAYARAGNQIEARKLLTELEERSNRDFVSPYLRATVHVALDEKQRAIELLEEAYSEHSIDIVQAKIDPKLNPLRGEQRFQTLVKKLGFPE